uniref:Secreted protein n=1 Tax=Daphnia galeata TaxID=27404 RepID=A0A8J2S3T3_9CRUS|nr:unnamed protein product [Daphnia galeata]
MKSKLLIIVCLTVSSVNSQFAEGSSNPDDADAEIITTIGGMQVPTSRGPADAFRFEFLRAEPRDDPSEFIIMCNLFRKFLYMPFAGTNP